MKPLDLALALWSKAGGEPDEFFDWCGQATANGVLYVGPDALLIAIDEGDCWFIWAAVGSPCKFFDLAPYRRERIAFARGMVDPTQTRREYSWDRLYSLFHHHHGRQTEETGSGRGTRPGRGSPTYADRG